MERVHAIVRGRVQGVWYRASTQTRARQLGLVGWVRNLPDGSVELVAEGPRAALDQLIAWCHDGPPDAVVTAVEPQFEAATGEFTSFEVRR
ncbi:MAG: acylphosphatase [Deltaproteobacteria bacterium]|nr:MAG: acylphosphatase [Deltaproteobacteria bacterium]